MKHYTVTRILLVITVALFCSIFVNVHHILGAEAVPILHNSISVSSLTYHGNNNSYYLATTVPIQIQGAAWIVLHFSDINLGADSYIEIRSVKDSAIQTLDAIQIEKWGNFSAFFNGDQVIVSLYIAPDDSSISFSIDRALVNKPFDADPPDCGIDDRVPSTDKRIGRVAYLSLTDTLLIWGTCFITSNGSLVSACHIFPDGTKQYQVQFNVPDSDLFGFAQFPEPSSQYSIRYGDIIKGSPMMQGNDWAVFTADINSETKLSPFQAQQASFPVAQNPIGDRITISGYGSDEYRGDLTKNGTLQQETGSLIACAPNIVSYTTFTENGESGGPVIDSVSGNVIGVHTNWNCDIGYYNNGTSFLNDDFWSAVSKVFVLVLQTTHPLKGDMIGVLRKGRYDPIYGFIWDNPFSTPTQFQFEIGSNHTFLADSDKHLPSRTKFYKWNNDNYFKLVGNFTISPTTFKIVSAFNGCFNNISIKNEVIGYPNENGGYIEFRDPWLLDSGDSTYYEYPYGFVNKGLNAIFKSEQSPFFPSYNSKYKGVFIDQDPEITQACYSTRVPSNQQIGDYNCIFDHWEATGAEVLSPFDTVTQVIFHNINAVVQAKYRALSTTVSSNLYENWNLRSVPVEAVSMLRTSLYPTASSLAFTLENDLYLAKDTLEVGDGYWIKFPETDFVNFTGVPVFADTMSVYTGWNLIGSITTPFPTNKINTIPEGITSSAYFTFLPTGYVTRDSIVPGFGYWIKTTGDGQLILNLENTAIPPEIIMTQPPPSPGAPPTPGLLSPTNGSTGVPNPPTLCWIPDEFGTTLSCSLQVATSSAFTTIVYQAFGLTSTCNYASNLSYSTTYYWRVKAVNEFGASSWSSIRWFTTTNAPPPDPDPDPCLTSNSIAALDDFTIINGDGKKQSLYAKNGKHKLDVGFTNFDMPPEPIGGIFHAKFKTDKFIENIQPGKGFVKMPIKIKNPQYPITLSWNIKSGNGVQYWISKSGEEKDKQALTGNGSLGLNNTKDGDIIIIATAIDPCDIEWKTGRQEGIDDQLSELPKEFQLDQNIPNPFNPTTIINYQLPVDAHVSIKVYNLLGEQVAVLVDRHESAGYKSVQFNANNLSNGVYYYRLEAGSYTGIKKMVLVK